MKNKILISTVILFVFCGQAYSQGAWIQKADFGGGARENATTFSWNGKGYVFGGKSTTSISYYRDLWEYDPQIDSWTELAHLPYWFDARSGAVSFVIGDTAYIGTGEGINGRLRDFFKYDFNSDIWIQINDFPGTAREGAFGFSIGSKGFIGSGYDINYSFPSDLWQYEVCTGNWFRKNNFPGTGRENAIALKLSGNRIYVGTSGGNFFTQDFWEYNDTSDTWIQKVNYGAPFFTTGIGYACGFAINGDAYIGTGATDQGNCFQTFNGFLKYDSGNDMWTSIADFGGGVRTEAIGFSIGNKGYVGLGYNGNGFMTDFWEFDPDTTIAGISPENNKINISVFPNPSQGNFQVSGNFPPKSVLQIYNMTGQEVIQPMELQEGNNSVQVSIDLANGIYFCKIISGEEILYVEKLLIAK